MEWLTFQANRTRFKEDLYRRGRLLGLGWALGFLCVSWEGGGGPASAPHLSLPLRSSDCTEGKPGRQTCKPLPLRLMIQAVRLRSAQHQRRRAPRGFTCDLLRWFNGWVIEFFKLDPLRGPVPISLGPFVSFKNWFVSFWQEQSRKSPVVTAKEGS